MNREEAIGVVRKNYPHVGVSGSEFETALRELVPELRESEDERIRKVLLNLVSNDKDAGYTKFYEERGITCDDAIAYLEKQKEQKSCSKDGIPPLDYYQGIMEGRSDVIDHPKQFGLQKPAEWSEEDEQMLSYIICAIRNHYTVDPIKDKLINWLRTRPFQISAQWDVEQQWCFDI